MVAEGGVLDIDTPAGCTVWLRRQLEGQLLITYEAKAVKAGGHNDRVSDLNCFWMAQDKRSPGDLFATARSGKFSDYDQLQCYYVGLGGNSNTTTRFRRYIGQKGNRPLLPEHDLKRSAEIPPGCKPMAADLALAAGSLIAYYYRDGRRLFTYEDPHPYVAGWFAFRTTFSHLQIRGFRVFGLQPKSGSASAASHP